MNVHLDHAEIADYKHAIADIHKILAEFVDVRFGRFLINIDYKELRAVRESDVRKVVIIEMRFFGILIVRNLNVVVERKRNVLRSEQNVIKALENDQKSSSARVHNARLSKHRKHFGSFLEHFFACFDR